MALTTHPAMLGVRRTLRAMGLTAPLRKLLGGSGYEQKFDAAMMSAVTGARLVWDVGANAGLYTQKFADALSSDGRVVAFEPSPRNANALAQKFSADERVTVETCALSDQQGQMFFEAAAEGDGTRDHIVDYDTGLKVEVLTADMLVFERNVPAPDFMKIDVEGFELHVFKGMGRMLSERPPRHIFCEVHFFALEKMGLKTGPNDIVKILTGKGYTVKWTDASHLHAHL